MRPGVPPMAKNPGPDRKHEALESHGAINPQAGEVKDPAFLQEEFFDARDLVQVRYEMVRRVTVEGASVSRTVEAFGCSRPTFYRIQGALEERGLPGLVPSKRGPRGGHKVKGEVLEAIHQARDADPDLSAKDLASMVRERFALSVHPRTIRRALEKKKRR